jgi:UDP-glucose 4-epimerase
MNVLLTGGSGFIGKNIIESYLSKKYNIIAPRHSELNLLNEDDVQSFFLNNSIDVVIHSAAKPGHRNSKDTFHILDFNSRMFFNLVRNSQYFKKLINLGSGAVYDMRFYKPKMKEDYFDTHVPIDEHGYCKYICSKYIEKVDNIIDLRIFGIFGKYEDFAIRFISNMICKSIFDLPLTMKQNKKFDYIYIDDLMPVLEYFILNNSKYSCYNVTPDKSIELFELAKKILNISGKILPIIISKEDMGLEYSGDNKRIKNQISNFSLTNIDISIEKLYIWYLNNKSLIDKNLLLIDK